LICNLGIGLNKKVFLFKLNKKSHYLAWDGFALPSTYFIISIFWTIFVDAVKTRFSCLIIAKYFYSCEPWSEKLRLQYCWRQIHFFIRILYYQHICSWSISNKQNLYFLVGGFSGSMGTFLTSSLSWTCQYQNPFADGIKAYRPLFDMDGTIFIILWLWQCFFNTDWKHP
jgi:hypothetical protein